MGGAGGAVGALAVARAQPDGYTLLLGSGGTQVIIPIASSQPTYDPVKAFETISLLGITAVCIAVHPSVPVHTLPRAYRLCQGQSRQAVLWLGWLGHDDAPHRRTVQGSLRAADIVHIPYRGAGPALTDAISRAYSDDHAQRDRAGDRAQQDRQAAHPRRHDATRVAAAPDIPTAIEAGLPNMISQNFVGSVRSCRDAQADHRAGRAGDAFRPFRSRAAATVSCGRLRASSRLRPRACPPVPG